jgi:DNA-binding CsgD family transcriptional regulator
VVVSERRATERDAHAVLAAAIDIADAARAGADAVDLLTLVAAVVPCDAASWSNMDKRQRIELRGACNVPDEGDPEAFAAFMHQHPSANWPMRAMASWDDLVTRSDWESTDLYNQFYRPVGVRHEMILQLGHTPPGFTNVLILVRFGGRDFDERERGLLWLLRPHLDAAFEPALPRRQLTTRQRQVLSLVREGYTNTQVARRLGVTPGTVRAHLEDIFARLEVNSRVGAVAAAAATFDGRD